MRNNMLRFGGVRDSIPLPPSVKEFPELASGKEIILGDGHNASTSFDSAIWLCRNDGQYRLVNYSIYSTCGICEVLDITPSELERRAMSTRLLRRCADGQLKATCPDDLWDQTDSGQDWKADSYVGVYAMIHRWSRQRARNTIADVEWTAECIQFLEAVE